MGGRFKKDSLAVWDLTISPWASLCTTHSGAVVGGLAAELPPAAAAITEVFLAWGKA